MKRRRREEWRKKDSLAAWRHKCCHNDLTNKDWVEPKMTSSVEESLRQPQVLRNLPAFQSLPARYSWRLRS